VTQLAKGAIRRGLRTSMNTDHETLAYSAVAAAIASGTSLYSRGSATPVCGES